MPPPPLVLASASPRRSQLLREYGYRAEVRPTHADESCEPWFTVRELVLLNARRKCLALAPARPEAVVLGADTLVCLDGQALGKPASLDEARAMLARLSGREHQVYSGVCLAGPGDSSGGEHRRVVVFAEETRVTFRRLDGADIDRYLALIDPLDKAGGYAAQEHPELIIAGVAGSWTNVLGLPMERLAESLEQAFAIRPAPA